MTGRIACHPHIIDAWAGIEDAIRPLSCEDIDAAALPRSVPGRVVLAREHKQHSGSVRARGALWFVRAKREAGALPAVGIAVAAGTESAAAAWAWAARSENVSATLFVPRLDAATVRELRGGPVTVEVVTDGDPAACRDTFAREVGAMTASPEDPLLAAGAGTWVLAMTSLVWDLATVMIPAVDDADEGLLLGTVAAAHHYGIKTVVVAVDGTPIPAAAQQVLSGAEFPGMVPDGHRGEPRGGDGVGGRRRHRRVDAAAARPPGHGRGRGGVGGADHRQRPAAPSLPARPQRDGDRAVGRAAVAGGCAGSGESVSAATEIGHARRGHGPLTGLRAAIHAR
ncbi:pyridoxal-phosphate dependent enzyme [Nocardia wallacei]|uniref:pyridoxal-phosphate dependent enzyme n=1 Tax=Nocardia wallacei TaxID=480035 RepID=UPI002456A3A9|nr:pyridoxal-phosphate dependent enzyme [Nocardia wallacei]